MENRKELSEKSKKLIAKQFKSDILNTSTGYYKTENIFPITPKPNELRSKIKEFIPKYKEIKPSEMHYNNLLSDQQKHNKLLMKNLKLIINKKNPELESRRIRAKTIKDNCYDERGNFSARKMRLLEFYGIEKMNIGTINHENINGNIKDRRSHNRSLFLQKIPKNMDLTNDNISIISNNDKNHFMKNASNKNNDIIKNENIEKIDVIEDDFFNDDIIIKNTNHNKFSRNRNNTDINYYLSTVSNEDYQNTVNCVNNKERMYRRIKTDINFTEVNNNSKNIKDSRKEREKDKKSKNKKFFYHPKELSKVFYTQNNKPVQSNRLNKYERDNNEKDYYNIEMKNLESIRKMPDVDQKKIKEIFYKNGLHLYDFNEDNMNILSTEKKMEAKLRKNKKDENFERNYRKVQKELKKLNIIANKREISNENGFESKVVRKKRKGTPGTQLFKNKEYKDENTKINTGFGFKRDKNILPQNNKNYKNNYNYKMTYFNHKKK